MGLANAKIEEPFDGEMVVTPAKMLEEVMTPISKTFSVLTIQSLLKIVWFHKEKRINRF